MPDSDDDSGSSNNNETEEMSEPEGKMHSKAWELPLASKSK